MQAIENYSWPGNVRELENKIKGAVIMAGGKMVTAADLGIAAGEGEQDSLNLREVRQRAETKAIRVALTKSSAIFPKPQNCSALPVQRCTTC